MEGFKSITKEEIENGFVNSELRDYEDRVRNNDLTIDEKKEIQKDLSDLVDILFG